MYHRMTIEEYLDKVAKFAGSDYGKMVREQFADIEGTTELGMLASPTDEELEQIRKAVAIMTPEEKQNAGYLNDEQVARIASDAGTDPAVFAIFMNGYMLHIRKPV
jgi:signal recognition particle GTPase